jgi:6-phosphogluconate dehydrogenase
MPPPLGFIGLDNRGEPIARNLLRAGYHLRAYNRTRVKAARPAEEALTPVPLASLLHDRWLSSMAKGRTNLDWSAIILDVADQAGINTMSAQS